tara:strand:- start:717 stop:944 length:228 start_codon:yes stop_codon:yes gene_type:complete
MSIDMTITETLDLKEMIVTKAEQISALALVAQAGSIEELTIDKIESLFGLFIDLSTDISNGADQINISSIYIERK